MDQGGSGGKGPDRIGPLRPLNPEAFDPWSRAEGTLPIARPDSDTVRWLCGRDPSVAASAGLRVVQGLTKIVVRDGGVPGPGERTVWLGEEAPDGTFARVAADEPDGVLLRWLCAARALTLAEERAAAAEASVLRGDVGGLIGISAPFRQMIRVATRLAPRPEPVFITGPPGSGKSHLARLIGEHHRRGPIRIFLPDSERDPTPELAIGLGVRDADERPGTLILEDVEHLGGSALRLLAFPPPGSPRLVFTSRLPLSEIPDLPPVLAEHLRDGTVAVPGLGDRGMDIEPIAEGFLRDEGSRRVLTPEAAAALRVIRWRDHVRELRGRVARVANGTGPIRASELQDHDMASSTPEARERALVEEALAAAGGDVGEVARSLGIPRSTLYRRLRRWGLTAARAAVGAAG